MAQVERAKGVGAARGPVGYRIERMTDHDLLEAVEIEETSGLSRWGWDSYHDELGRADSIMLVARLVAPDESGKSVAGFVAARYGAGELHVNNIGVREVARRQGIGTALLESAVTHGGRMGAQSVFLEVRAGNKSAQSLYLRQGFEIVGRRRNYYHDPAEDALIMRKHLGA